MYLIGLENILGHLNMCVENLMCQQHVALNP